MPRLTLTNTVGSFTWQITGLSSPFNQNYYQGACLTRTNYGSSASSVAYFTYQSAPASSSNYYTPRYSRNASAGTYTYYAYMRAANGTYYYAGSDTVTVTENTVTIPSYSVGVLSDTSIRFYISNASTYTYFRIYVRLGNTDIEDRWVNIRGGGNYDVTGLSPRTTYTVNVAYNTTNSSYGSVWMGSTTVTTTNTQITYWYAYRFMKGNTYLQSTAPMSVRGYSGGATVNPSTYTPPDPYIRTNVYSVYSGAATWNGTYFTVRSTDYYNRALLNYGVRLPQYNLNVYRVYGGSTTLQGVYTYDANTVVQVSQFIDAPAGYAFDHAENNYGTTVTSVTMTESKSLYMYYVRTDYTLSVYDVYDGEATYRGNYSVTAGSTVYPSNYASANAGWEFSYGESPKGTRVSSFQMNSDRGLYIYYTRKNTTLNIYDYYDGQSHFRKSVSIAYGLSINPSNYTTTISGYSYDHAESPLGTRVSSLTMNGDKNLYLIYYKTTVAVEFYDSIDNTLYSRTVNIEKGIYINPANYARSYTDYKYDHAEYPKGTIVTSVYITDNMDSIYLIYTYNGAKFQWDTNNNCSGRRPTSNEWKRLIEHVEKTFNTTISRKGEVNTGGTLSCNLFNELASKVNYSQVVSKGQRIFVSMLNTLRDKANKE